MLGSIISMFGGQIVEKIFGSVKDLFGMYINKQITEAELKAKLQQAIITAVRDIEVSHSETLAKTYESFQVTLRGSRIMQAAWIALFLSQMLTLVWYQMGVPALCYFIGEKSCYPSAGSTVDWSYLLLAFMLGAGPVVLRSGPGVGSIGERIKAAVGWR